MGEENSIYPPKDMNYPPKGYASSQTYALSGKIMLSAIVILFTVVLLIVCFHIYARCFLIRNRRLNRHRHNRRRRRRTDRTHFVFTSITPSNDTIILPSRGLDPEILKSIPTFIYSPLTTTTTTHDGDLLECAVCLSEFEENEEGRTLPKCNHSFHSECIDMWFHSHSSCPLCRSPVNNPEISVPPELHEIPIQIVIDSGEPSEQSNTGSFEPCLSCKNEMVEIGSGSSSGSGSGSGSGSSSNSTLTIEIHKREGSFSKGNFEEENQGSPGGNHQNLKSPGSRILSLKRILSREKKPSVSSNSMGICSYVSEIDPEKGGEEEEEEPEQVYPVQQDRSTMMLERERE